MSAAPDVSTAETRPRRHAPLAVGAFLPFAGLGVASLSYRPIQATVAILLGAIGLGVVARRSAPASAHRYWWAGAATGLAAVLVFYYTSALINLEPNQVIQRG